LEKVFENKTNVKEYWTQGGQSQGLKTFWSRAKIYFLTVLSKFVKSQFNWISSLALSVPIVSVLKLFLNLSFYYFN
jgi:hypothetical protein